MNKKDCIDCRYFHLLTLDEMIYWCKKLSNNELGNRKKNYQDFLKNIKEDNRNLLNQSEQLYRLCFNQLSINKAPVRRKSAFNYFGVWGEAGSEYFFDDPFSNTISECPNFKEDPPDYINEWERRINGF